MGAKKQQRIIDALNVLAKDAPEIYSAIVHGECPHDAGLTEPNSVGKCGFKCEGCWRLAMGGKP